ncbi:glucose 1-dehydrogenase [Salsipaludibacter albus]|uniref:glucose 1-dehydrogenase n=1 Tax=Salsipaludibacter albus TaxID=2849650 RepID=UPI001EE473FF|nr:glucose 1-dehydrogenase [Salsipaludibacter albus]MBY5160965.1 glucose 1-dehydrogenase [Salsipaludibacter albus]
MTGRLEGKVAIITGSGAGFGAGAARLFAEQGATVVVADIDGDSAKAVADEITGVGGRARPEIVDVTRTADLEAMVARTVDEYGQLDIMFNNAGIPMSPTPIEETTDELYERIARINMYGVFAGCRAVVPAMKRQGGGVILNTASTAAVRPRPGLGIYNASKSFALNLTKTLALELAPHNIRVNAINPVMGDTGMLGAFSGDRDPVEARKAFEATIPLGRLSTPQDIAWAAVYLASDEAAMVTGIGLDVDGGRDV